MARRRAVAISAPPKVSSKLLRRLLFGVLTLFVAVLLVLAGVGGFFTFRILTQHNDTESVSPTTFIDTNFESLSFTNPFSGEHEGWLLRGLKGAPAIILCPGYDSNRADLLSLGVVLQENHFNVYVFNFHGPGTKGTFSNLGISQAEDVKSAIEMVTKHEGINPHRVGLFGSTTGGYAALVAAQNNSEVKALVVDSIYEKPLQMFDAQLNQLMGGPSTLFRILADKEFQLVNWRTKNPPVRENLSKLAKIPKLFVSDQDAPLLASLTEDLYNAAPDPKQMRMLENSVSGDSGAAERKEYENQILSFFLQNLPLRAD
jgi:pimeloyl-ACP methyl ester carboxylesterase